MGLKGTTGPRRREMRVTWAFRAQARIHGEQGMSFLRPQSGKVRGTAECPEEGIQAGEGLQEWHIGLYSEGSGLGEGI